MTTSAATGYTDAEREAIEQRGAAGGVVAYIRRLSDGHRFTFHEGKDGNLHVGVCTCGEVMCHGPYIGLHRAELIAAYEAKVQDFASETRRTSLLSAVVRRMFVALAGEWNNAKLSQRSRRDFYNRGFPPDEREALLAALPDDERASVEGGTDE